MKKKILSFITVMVLTLSVCMTALAEEDTGTGPVPKEGTAAELKSYGAIVYQKGSDSVKIDSNDLYTLADQIDQVKLQVTDQLEAMNTYFTAGEGEITLNTSEDISVVHAKPFEEDSVDPLGVNFDTLLEGIAVSQSVSTDAAAYGYPTGTELYKTANGLLTTNGSGAGTEKVNVVSATADNLSAGTAAWVDGSLILGTGSDNKSYHNKGYDEGYKKGYDEGRKKFSGDFVLTGTPKNPDPSRYMCYAASCYHHSLSGKGYMLIPKSFSNPNPYGSVALRAGQTNLPYFEGEVNYYLWGPISDAFY